MATLKPQEIRCLLLKAEGLSYQEICEVTGFSYTKVNRCITEGRRTFLKRVAGIEAGAECQRLAPVISKVADGEATAEEMHLVRPHLKGCLACKATLREYRATPARLAAVVPPVVALAGDDGGGGAGGLLARLVERFAGMGDAAGAKVAAVAAAGAMLAGGGAVAGVDVLHHDAPRVAPSAFADPVRSAGARSVSTRAAAAQPASSAPDPSTAAIQAVADPAPGASTEPAAKRADPRPEFDPGMAGGSSGRAPASTLPPAAAPSTPTRAAPKPRRTTPAPAPEFGP
jgi:hypothetical protein